MEVVRTLDGVEWINDSKATNVDSSVVALRAFQGGVWLIAGGLGKGAPYAPMVETSRGKVRAVLTIGQDAPAIEAAYRGQADVVSCGTLERAVEEARRRAGRGDVVLLSPACASYDQFKNFEDRGDTFKRLVGALT
jgi:UDP-N-acetylmuramoylalanine--D-glutamate ligase